MRSSYEYPLNDWRLNHQHLRDSDLWIQVGRLDSAFEANYNAIQIEKAWEAWLADRSLPVPDLAKCVALYGYSRLLVQGWKEFPIEVPPDKVEVWREWGLGASLFEFRGQWQAGVAGGFLEIAVQEPAFTGRTLKAQSDEKLAELKELAAKPLEWYTPKEFTEEEEIEGEDWPEIRRLHKIFDLYEDFVCFSYGLEKFRMFSLQHDATFGLPSVPLYHALQDVDLNHLLGEMDKVEPKLRPILRFLASKNFFVGRVWAPKNFWWRHWKPENELGRKPRPHKAPQN